MSGRFYSESSELTEMVFKTGSVTILRLGLLDLHEDMVVGRRKREQQPHFPPFYSSCHRAGWIVDGEPQSIT
jgi:hypothetical protein